MTDYPLIDPKDVREGDVVQITYTYEGHDATLRGAVWRDDNSKRGDLYVGFVLMRAFPSDVRLVHRPAPPEPPLRVGDWVRDDHGCTWQIANEYGLTNCHGLTRIEPPEPPLRVGDWVRDPAGIEGQVTSINAGITLIRYNNGTRGGTLHVCARVEPPVGWPVGVPTEDGGTRWYVRDSPFGNYKPTTPERDNREWADLLAAGGTPAARP